MTCRLAGSEPDWEEGEIDTDFDAEAAALLGCEWSADKQAHAWLALALFERLSGDGDKACEAADKAVAAAAGNQQACQLVLCIPADQACLKLTDMQGIVIMVILKLNFVHE